MFNLKLLSIRTAYERWISPSSRYTYTLSSSDDENESFIKEASSPGLPANSLPRRVAYSFITLLPWMLSLFFGCTSIFLYVQLKASRSDSKGSFDRGFSTDFGPMTSSISVHEVWFTGTLDIDRHGNLYIPHPGPVNYSGAGPEVDRAWEELTFGDYFPVSEEEAMNAFHYGLDELYNPQVEGYEVGIDMFHTLHCVDVLRKLMYPEVYPPTTNPVARMHTGHCVEQVRQYIMCAGDISPIPVKYHAATRWGDKSYAYSDVPHTCRNFGQIQDWMHARFGSLDKSMQYLLEHQ